MTKRKDAVDEGQIASLEAETANEAWITLVQLLWWP